MDHDPGFSVRLHVALDLAGDAEQAGAHDDAAMGFEDPRPDHEVGDAEFVLQGDEDHARSGARSLAHQHQPRHLQEVAGLGLEQSLRIGHAPLPQRWP
jgi:hypothetical protein